MSDVSVRPNVSPPAPQRLRGVIGLSLGTAIVIFVWCVVLPWVAEWPAVKQRMQFLDERRIDPSAMFYTELDAMDAILEKLEDGR